MAPSPGSFAASAGSEEPQEPWGRRTPSRGTILL